jgi:ketosteroid isomerase-like protein
MAQENVEIVRRGLEAFVSDTEAFRDILHPEIEWYPIEKNRRPSKGIEAAMWDRNQWLDTWDEHRLDVEEMVEEGDSVVASVHITARGKASGVEVDVRFYPQVKVRDGKVVYIYDHEDREAAVEAARLSE